MLVQQKIYNYVRADDLQIIIRTFYNKSDFEIIWCSPFDENGENTYHVVVPNYGQDSLDYYETFELPELRKFINGHKYDCKISLILGDLVKHNMIPHGEYLIKMPW